MGTLARPRLWMSDTGTAIIEFALALPLLILLVLGAAEVLYYLRLTQQMEKTVQMTGSILSQMTRVSEEDFPLFFTIATDLMGRKSDQTADQAMRIRQYGCKENRCGFNWWRDGAGEWQIAEGANEPFPAHVSQREKESLIQVALWVHYRPLVAGAVGIDPILLRRDAFFKTSPDYPLNSIITYKRP